MNYFVMLFALAGGVLLYLLSQATHNSPLFADNYPLLLGIGSLLLAGLLLLVAFQVYTLRRKLKNRIFGAKLTVRLVRMFMLMTLLPGLVIYGVSVLFLQSSIDTWFNVRVDTALVGGLNLGRTALDHQRDDLVKKADGMAQELALNPPADTLASLNRLRERYNVQEATLINAQGEVLAFSSADQAVLRPDLPSSSILRQVRQQQTYGATEDIPGKGLRMRAVAPVNMLSLHEPMRYLQLVTPVPAKLAADAEQVEAGYRDYQELFVSRVGLKRLYGFALTLTLMLALFSAFALSFLLSERLSEPLGLLAEGTRAVARGNFSRMPVQSRDELGSLMRSFNSMTRQLSDAREAAEISRRQTEAAKSYLETILAHLSSGVLSFDTSFHLVTANPVAAVILGLPLEPLSRLSLRQWSTVHPSLKALAATIHAQFIDPAAREWQIELAQAGVAGNQILLLRGSRLPRSAGHGYIVVFDDITHIIQAQRNAAWAEVARRLAHEIKNPLTPIQLSAERLQHKLAGKLAPDDAQMLERATLTIVNQVTAMKTMVDAFSDYARLPKPRLQELALNQLLAEVTDMYEAFGIRILQDLHPGLAPAAGDPTLMRQVIHNLLQNAQDALAGLEGAEIRVRSWQEGGFVKLSVADNGHGFAAGVMERAFEPYVTTKPKGTGLGLAVVKKIIEEHKGVMTIENIAPHGARVIVALPVAEHA